MRRPSASLFLACAALLAAPPAAEARLHRRHAPAAPRPVLVELFTAQGCEGCPQADLDLADLARKKGMIALSFSVDIWDYTGWTDTLAQPEFTQRQQAYVKRLKLREIYTPEVVVDGAGEAAGSDKEAVAALIGKTARNRVRGPKIGFASDGDKVSLGAARAPAQPADVWLIRYDPKPHEVKVKAGDNHGKTVVVTNAVRELVKLGQWRGKAKRFDLPDAASEGQKAVVVVQAPHGGPVIAMMRE